MNSLDHVPGKPVKNVQFKTGASTHDLPKVFDEHFSKGKINGNGLGLYYVKKMINSWGGTITIDSSLGSGTNVKIGFLQSELRG